MRPAAPVLALLACPCLVAAACSPQKSTPREPMGAMPEVVTTAEPEWIPWSIRAGKPAPADPRERHLTELRQLTSGGENAEARWSADGKKLVFQSRPEGAACAQVFVMDLGSGETKQVSTGGGTAMHGAFYPAGDRLLYASTRAAGEVCSPPREGPRPRWPLEELDVYSARVDGSDARKLLAAPGHDAEPAVALDGSRIVFTSTRDGDPELYTANLDGTRARRITAAPGYDGGAAFSPDGARVVWRASRPATGATGAATDRGPAPTEKHDLWIAGAEGQGARRLTTGAHDHVAATFLPDSRRVLFAADIDAPGAPRGAPPELDLYVIDPDGPLTGTGGPAVERITFAAGTDTSPAVSPDGRYVAFTSSRHGRAPGETNVFVARWVP